MGSGAVQRIFLGWDRPVLDATATYLIDSFTRSDWELDVSNVVVVTPGGRASRNLLGRLIDAATQRGLACGSPIMMTPGELPTLSSVGGALPPASDDARRMAWRTALAECDAETLEPLVPVRPTAGRSGGWDALAKVMQSLHDELCGELMTFAELPARTKGFAAFTEDSRWQAASVVQNRYVELLQKWGFHDPAWSAMLGLREQTTGLSEHDIVLVGVAELSAAARTVVERAGERARTLIFAPESASSSFDACGCIRVDRPPMVPAIEAGWIHFVDDPLTQADAAFASIAKASTAAANGGLNPSDIVIGVPDDSVVACLERRAEQIGGVRVRSAAGHNAAATSPARFLNVLRDLVNERSLANVLAWARHEAVNRWLCELNAATTEFWLAKLDDFAASDYSGELPMQPCAGPVRKGLDLVACLKIGRGASPAMIAEAIFADLRTMFGGLAAAPTAPADRVIVQTCLKIRDSLKELVSLSDRPISDEVVEFPRTLDEVLAHVGANLENQTIPDEPSPDAIELLGWLEVPFDPAPVLVITGMNEGSVPSRSMADPFLPDGLRKHLGVSCDERRLARDAYLLCAATQGRRSVTLTAARRAADGSPLLPSRLLMLGQPSEVVDRMKAFVEQGRQPDRPLLRVGAGGTDRFCRPLKTQEVCVRSMSVTDFAKYIASPYRFYLERVLKLKETCEAGSELDPLAFGNLVHAALQGFGAGKARWESKQSVIEEAMLEALESSALKTVGPIDRAPVAIRVQLEFARRRLTEVARAQADWRAQGWKISHVEWTPEAEETVWDSGSGVIGLRGRIDRIDVNEQSSAVAILDYKTGDTVGEPKKDHVSRGKWFGLQLPLYRHLAANLPEMQKAQEKKAAVSLGYFRIPRKVQDVGVVLAEWNAEDLKAADATAAAVVSAVRAGAFAKVGDPGESGGSLDRLCGVGFLGEFAPLGEAEEEDSQ